MMAKLLKDFAAGTGRHWLFDTIAVLVHEQSIRPKNQHITRLTGKMWLAITGNAQDPIGISEGNDPSGYGLARIRIVDREFFYSVYQW